MYLPYGLPYGPKQVLAMAWGRLLNYSHSQLPAMCTVLDYGVTLIPSAGSAVVSSTLGPLLSAGAG